MFGSGYYKKADTLILSARLGDEIIETVEVDLRTLEVVQCHGKHNQDTEYHERIIDPVSYTHLVELLSMKDIKCDTDIPETADTLEGNALLKAKYLSLIHI